MKIVVVSDTHDQHEALGVLQGDLLIHCGDVGMGDGPSGREIERLDAWFARQRFGAIVCIGGNHDFELQEQVAQGRTVFRHAHYLQDQTHVFQGLKLYGSPWVPELADWAFHAGPAVLRRRWNAIPDDTDILVTHTPPRGLLDRNSSGRACGCPLLRQRLRSLRLRLHCFGHIHASTGMKLHEGTWYVNAAVVDRSYRVARAPCEIDLKP